MQGRQQGHVALIVEDEPLLRLEIVEEGWEVLDAATGEAAVGYVEHQPVDVVFTDIQLAGPMCGWDVAEKIRATQTHMPVVYASGNAADRSRKVAGSLFFNKPYDLTEVVDACHRLIQDHDTQ
jgi:CheY-like chemotaxis protein